MLRYHGRGSRGVISERLAGYWAGTFEKPWYTLSAFVALVKTF
jgi:hypothetical protein